MSFPLPVPLTEEQLDREFIAQVEPEWEKLVYHVEVPPAAKKLREFRKIVLDNSAYRDMILSDVFTLPTYYMGLVDEQNRVNFYDGMVRVVDPEGREFVQYAPHEYTQVIAEHVEPWAYLKFPFSVQDLRPYQCSAGRPHPSPAAFGGTPSPKFGLFGAAARKSPKPAPAG